MQFDRKKVFTAMFVCLAALVSATYAHAATFTIGGTVSGLTTGTSVTLLDNGADSLTVAANGKFTFATALATGATYNVTVSKQPSGLTCTVTAGSGTVGTANVTTVKVTCKTTTYTIGGTLSGLITGRNITLLDNGASALKLTANGVFTFKTQLASGAKYAVTISIQPAGQTCTVTSGSGTVATANVTSVAVACTPLSYTIGGTVSGLTTGKSLVLADNATDTLTVTANGTYTFATKVASGAAYKVTVKTQPAGETCTVAGGAGKVAAANITNAVVTCTPKTFTISGTLSGLATGATVTMLDNGGDSLPVTVNGKFTFATKVASGSTYNVTVGTQPTGATCTVTAGSGTVGTANVTTVKVVCASSGTFSIGGTLSGLNASASVKLLDNGGDALTLTANGTFTFATKLASGAKYAVTVGTQPTGETCTVTAGSGTVGSANVTNVAVACQAATTYSIGGTVSGLNTGTSVILLNNGGNSLTVSANGSFTFTTKLASGAAYSVTVGTQPTGETCTVTNGSGTVGTANVTNVAVACKAAATFSIGGTVSGLNSGTSVTLLDNGADSLTVSANGTFTFATKLASGAAYSVTVGTEPTGETCTVTNGSGTVGTANVTNIAVTCSASTGGSGAYWIPYSAMPTGATPVGQNGLFLIPSDKLSSAPAPTFVTTDNTQLLGIGTQITESGGVLTYSPQVMMYSDTSSTGVTKIFGLTLAGTATVPTPKQISNISLPSGQGICSSSGTALTDVSTPTTLFAVLEVGTPTQCGAGTGTFEVVHYTDSSTTAPVVVSINSTNITTVYQSGKLTAILLFNSATSSFNSYATDAFTSPTQLITGLSGVNNVHSVLDAATLSTTGYFFQVTTTGAVNELYRIDGGTLAATLIQNLGTGNVSASKRDDTNLYYMVVTPGTSTSTATFNQVALTGGTPKLLYTTPAFGSTTAVQSYQLVGSNDSVLVFEFASVPFTNGLQDPTKATATIYTVPVGTTTTTPTTLANYAAGNELPYIFLSAPTGSSYAGNVLFATLLNSTGPLTALTESFSAVSIPLNGGAAPAPIAKSVYAPLAVISDDLTDSVWQVTGITDTNGGFGGGTANLVTVSNLTDTPFTTTGGGHYVFPAGFGGSLFAISSNNIALGFLENSAAVQRGTATLQENGVAADLSKAFFYPVIITNTYVLPY